MPRSGTSLAEQILAAHPVPQSYGEVTYFAEIVRNVLRRKGGTKYPDRVDEISDSDLEAIGKSYFEKLSQHGSVGKVTTDKALNNYKYVGLIYQVFPNAKVIHCQRDIRDAGLSIYQKEFYHPDLAYSFDLECIAEEYRAYRTMVNHWDTVLPNFVYTLDYEQLVQNFEATVRDLLSFCELPWDNNCLNYADVKNPVPTPSAHQVRQPIFQSSVGKWRMYEKFLGPLLAVAGS